MSRLLSTCFAVLAFTASLFCGAPLLAQGPVDLSGFWQLRFDSKNVPRASLTAAAAEADKDALIHHDAWAIRWCHHLGVPYMMESDAPIDIRQGRFEVAIAAQMVSAARHIYIDGRGHPNPDTYDPTTDGHSVGIWEGDSLIVDTTGFSKDGYVSIPGGGFRTQDSHLVERYHLLDNGSKLVITFTWYDPKVFKTPHSYEYTYFRAPKDFYAHEYFCDASRPERETLLLQPVKDVPAPKLPQ